MTMLAVAGPIPVTTRVPPIVVMDEGQKTDQNADDGSTPRVGSRNAGAGAEDNGQWFRLGEDPYAVTGPPPAFAANVLEADRAFQRLLARLDAERAAGEVKQLVGDGTGAPDGLSGRSTPAGALTGAEIALGQDAPRPPPLRAIDWLQAVAKRTGDAATPVEPAGQPDGPAEAETETTFGDGESAAPASGLAGYAPGPQDAADEAHADGSGGPHPHIGLLPRVTA